jgi:hypothetical protein
MHKITLTFLLFFVLTGWARAEEQNFTNEPVDSSVSDSICPGNWMLSNLAGWVVQNEEGLILPLSANSVVLGCDGKPLSLTGELSGSSVGIKCAPSSITNGLPDVLTVNIWCK